jgi:hypothetical protein
MRGETWSFTDNVMIFINNQLLGDTEGFLQWSRETYNFEDFRNDILYETLRKETYANHIANTKVKIYKKK